MFVEQCLNNGVPYLRLVKSYRTEDSLGRKVARKKTVLNIGPLSRFDDGKPDYVKRLKESYKNGKPLIDALLPFVESTALPLQYSVIFTSGEDYCVASPKLVAPLLLDRIFRQLGLDTLCATLKHSLKIEYDLAGFLRLLVYGRILHPASKIDTTRQNENYYTPLTDVSYPYHIYNVLDVLNEYKDQFVRRIHSSICKSMGRSTSHIFYDVTNFFFEIDEPDSDEEIKGKLTKGLRQKGVSKENRKEPIVQMGLFMDENGIPITMETFPGNTLDQATLRPALKRSLNTLDVGRFILVADRGIHSNLNLCHLVKDGQGYVVSKSIRKTQIDERKWILEPEGYVSKGNSFRIKSRIMERTVKDESGNTTVLKQKIVVYWSQKFYDRDRKEHKNFLEFLEKYRQNPTAFRVTALQVRQLQKYFKKEYVNQKTGEIVDSRQLMGMLDEEKAERLTAYMGYYQIVTSELDMPDEEVVKVYHGLTQIEDQFREMKGTLETRPMYVSTRDHISGHLFACMIALVMLRLIQKRIAKTTESNDKLWNYGMSGKRVQAALQKWQIEKLPNDLYRFCNVQDEDVKKLLDAFSIDIPLKLYTRGEIRKIKTKIKV